MSFECIFEEQPKQRQFAEAVFSGQYRILAYGGGIRSGKTYALLAVLFALCRIFPRSRWAIVRKDLPTLRRNTIPSFNKLRPRTFVEEINQTTWTARCTNGSEILFFPESLDVDPDLDRWKGLEVNGFALEEANELDVKSFNKSIERAGSWIIPGKKAVQPDPLVLLSFNPSPNWVKRKFYDPWKAGTLDAPYFYLPATIADNAYAGAEYRESLKSLPVGQYRRFVEGDWDSMSGMALPELGQRHFKPKGFVIPDHWPKFMAFDWGRAHPFSVGLYASDTEGAVYKMDTLSARGMTDPEIFEYVAGALEARSLTFSDFRYTVAGGDCWNKQQLKNGILGPSTAETFTQRGWPMVQAADGPGSRVAGLSNLSRYLTGESPKFYFLETDGNRRCFEQLQGMMLDPDKPEDALKTNADEDGEGGDDMYDETRYALMSRPILAKPLPKVLEEGRHPGVDWKAGKVKHRPDAETEIRDAFALDAKITERRQRHAWARWK